MPSKKAQQLIVTIKMPPADAERLVAAFKEGKLADLCDLVDQVGDVGIANLAPAEEPRLAPHSFAAAEKSKRSRKKKDDTPPLP